MERVEPLGPPAQPAPLDAPLVAVEGDDLAPVLPVLVDLARECGSAVAFQPMREGLGGACDPGSLAIHVDARLSVNGAVNTLVYELVRADRHDGDPVLA